MRLQLLEGTYAVARLAPDAEVPPALRDGPADAFVSITRTGEELSLVAPETLLAGDVGGPQRLLRVAGTLDHGLTGILASLSASLAEAGVPIFALSTWDTDYLLVPSERLEDAVAALEEAGHEIRR